MSAIAGLLLAAGEGSRLGLPKALVEIGGERLVDRGIRLLRDGGCEPVLAVLGAAALDLTTADVVMNPHWRSGMGSSLRAGLAALPDSTQAVVVALVDQPNVSPEAIWRLVGAYESGASAAVASYQGRPRNPALFARTHWPAIAATAVGDVGARPFIRGNPALITYVECGDIASPSDVDTPTDLAALTDESG